MCSTGLPGTVEELESHLESRDGLISLLHPIWASAFNTSLDFEQVLYLSEAWFPPLGNQNRKVHPV